MGSKYLFVALNAILLFAQISNIIAQAPKFQHPGRLLTPEEGCGVSKVSNTKIVGGSEAKRGEYPWLALIFYMVDASGAYAPDCGGSLITSRHVLTAGHCIKPLLSFVRLGLHDLDSMDDSAVYDVEMVKKARHPNFNDEFFGANDIGIITLDIDVIFSDRIRPICLPLNKEFQGKNLVGLSPFIAGWGDLTEDGDPASLLNHVQIPILDNAQCKEIYRQQENLESEMEFGDAALCAGYLDGGKDSCQGDSGGPLMLPILNGTFHTYQIGIISYGVGCAHPNSPGSYTNVQYFMDWIQEIVNRK